MAETSDSEAAAVQADAILDALRTVQDPDLHQDIVSLGFVKDLRVCGSKVAFTIELTTPACPVKDRMKKAAEEAVRALRGVDEVHVTMSAKVTSSAPPSYEGRPRIPGVRNVVAVSSGKGGVGKSTVAVNLACALQSSGARVAILDADLYGPNVPLMLGLKGPLQARGDKMVPLERNGLQVVSIGFMLKDDEPVVWRGPMLHRAIKQFLFDVAWDDRDYLIVDLPPGTGDAQLSLSQQAHVTGSVIVTTPQEVSVQDVRKAIRMFEKVNVPILGVIENMAYFSPPGSEERYEIFGSGGGDRVCEEFGLPLLGRIPIDPEIRAGGDRGEPIVWSAPDSAASRSFVEAAGQLAARISTRNAGVGAS